MDGQGDRRAFVLASADWEGSYSYSYGFNSLVHYHMVLPENADFMETPLTIMPGEYLAVSTSNIATV